MSINDQIDNEVKRYLKMKEEKGYGHTLQDVEKHVRAGIAIMRDLQKLSRKTQVCSCGNELTEKELFYETCLKCEKTV